MAVHVFYAGGDHAMAWHRARCPIYWIMLAWIDYPASAIEVIDQGVFIPTGMSDEDIDGDARPSAPPEM
jgi:hypothetical protein